MQKVVVVHLAGGHKLSRPEEEVVSLLTSLHQSSHQSWTLPNQTNQSQISRVDLTKRRSLRFVISSSQMTIRSPPLPSCHRSPPNSSLNVAMPRETNSFSMNIKKGNSLVSIHCTLPLIDDGLLQALKLEIQFVGTVFLPPSLPFA
jgi:hypothetical protein